MWVISQKALHDFWTSGHAKAERPLLDWYKTVKNARWNSISDIRAIYPSADGGIEVASGNRVTVFNIGGGLYRLVAAIHYNTQRLFVLRIMTHAEYSKNKWKS